MLVRFDNFLSREYLLKIQQKLTQSHWGFGFTSTEYDKPIWNFDKEQARGVIQHLMDVPQLENYTLLDYHVNGQTILLDGSWHRDNYEGASHALVYFPYAWNHQWGGRLHIQTPTGIEIITPQENMCILFDSSWPHYAESTTLRAHNKLRVSVGLKLLAK